MARALRVEYPGALYHVMARGNHGQPVFRDDVDRQGFWETLGEACEKTGWRIHAGVLMPNHYHLLLETPEPNLVAGMKWLQGTYTQRHNGRHKLSGHLFQGRYKAILIDSQAPEYLQVVSTYIHLNPARAGVLRPGEQRLKEYRWSSYPWYLVRPGKRPAWLCTERVMASLGLRPEQARGYEAYLESRVLELGIKARRTELEEQWRALRRGWYVGGREFGDRLMDHLSRALKGRRRESHSGAARRSHDEAAAEAALKRAVAVFGVEPEALGHMPLAAPEKVAVAWWLRQHTTAPLRWVSERLAMGHYTRVAQAVSRMNRRPGRRLEQLRRKLEGLEAEGG